MSPLRREITDSRLKTRDAFDALHNKIASYILQRSKVGSPADINNVNQAKGSTVVTSSHLYGAHGLLEALAATDDEFCSSSLAAAALQSVFPHTEVGAFMALLKKDKEQQLDELTRIVTGICLFNKASMNEQQQPLST